MSNWFITSHSGCSASDLRDDYGFLVQQAPGAGMPPIKNIVLDYGILDGGLWQDARVEVRNLILSGTISGSSIVDLHKKRSNLIRAISHDRISPPEPVVLKYTGGACDVQASAYYAGGLEFSTVGKFTEQDVNVQFVLPKPVWERTVPTTCDLNTHIVSSCANGIMQRDSDGQWREMGASAFDGGSTDSRSPRVIVSDAASDLYVGGLFGEVNGVDNTQGIAKWVTSTSSWESLSGSYIYDADAEGVMDMVVDIDNSLIIATSSKLWANSGAACAPIYGIMCYDPNAAASNTWSTFGGSTNDGVSRVTFDSERNVWISGAFNKVGACTVDACGIAFYDRNTWQGISSSFTNLTNEGIRAIDVDREDKYLYFGGIFDSLNASTACYLGRYDINASTFDASLMGTPDNHVLYIARDTAENVIVLGAFETIGTFNASGMGRWVGSKWESIGAASDVNGRNGGVLGNEYALRIRQDNEGRYYLATQLIYTINGKELQGTVSQGALFNGATWVLNDFMPPGEIQDYHISDGGIMTVCWEGKGSSSFAGHTAVAVNGTNKVFPKISLSGPGRLARLTNYSTGHEIFFDITLSASEVVTLDLTNSKKVFDSNFRGSVFDSIEPGSEVTDFHLVPGTNNIGMWVSGTDAASTAAEIEFKDIYWSFDT